MTPRWSPIVACAADRLSAIERDRQGRRDRRYSLLSDSLLAAANCRSYRKGPP